MGEGKPLQPEIRRTVEAFFQTDFSDVRVHRGLVAQAMGALAFTMDNTVYFAPNAYDPATRAGMELLGHELTHVLQQRHGRVTNLYGHGVAIVQDPELEAEADEFGRRLADQLGLDSRRNVGQMATMRHGTRWRDRPSGSKARRATLRNTVQLMDVDTTPEDELPGWKWSYPNVPQGFYHGLASRAEHQDRVEEEDIYGKTYLYLGSGDFSAPAQKALKHEDDNYKIFATELQPEHELAGSKGNVRRLLELGHTVAFEVDATSNIKGVYDRIIFHNPHTGKYGNASSYHHTADVESIASNKLLLSKIFQQAKGHLEPGGKLVIHICGYPYKSSKVGRRFFVDFRQGMGLEDRAKANEFGEQEGWTLVDHKDKGKMWVRRNNGIPFQADVIKLSYRPIA